ncbi:MAG: hypothetical protein H0W85_10855 [Methylotenera sp.]|nr:hypothetical protein [Methylotenera sp.]
MPFSDVQHQLQTWQDRVLGIVVFSESDSANLNLLQQDVPTLHLNAPVLTGEDIACEVWLSDIPAVSQNAGQRLISGRQGGIKYRFNDELLFGVIHLEESTVLQDTSMQNDRITPLQQATKLAYRQIFELIDDLGYSHLFRFWNYMADINGSSHDLERYRQFNVGRKQALVNYDREAGSQLPAACALGLTEGPLSIAFLAGRTEPVAIENPRQIKAYDYPEQYGPRTPSFSRATLLNIEQQATLFISGTASIVGHQTLHAMDIAGQTRETLVNLDAVIAEANRIMNEPKFSLNDVFLRVYIRYAEDLALVRTELQNYLKGEIKAMFIQADICRPELLIEIEATIQSVVATT